MWLNTPFSAPFTLNVQGENFNVPQTSIGSSQSMRQFTATYSISYVIQNAKGITIYGPKTVAAHSTINVMPDEEISSSSKLLDTKQSMIQDVVNQLLFQLSSKNAQKALKK